MKTKKTFKTAFNLNLLIILFFGLQAMIFDLMIFYMVAFIFLMLLPACSTKS